MPRRAKSVIARTMRIVAAAFVLAGAAAILWRPAPSAGQTGRGRMSHVPAGAALAEGYEVKDLPAKGLAYILIGLAVSASLLVAIVFGMIALFAHWDAEGVSALTRQQTAAITPPGPPLQSDPLGDLARLRARERQALQGYAWLDPAHTSAHVPIDRAMALVVGHSLDEAP